MKPAFKPMMVYSVLTAVASAMVAFLLLLRDTGFKGLMFVWLILVMVGMRRGPIRWNKSKDKISLMVLLLSAVGLLPFVTLFLFRQGIVLGWIVFALYAFATGILISLLSSVLEKGRSAAALAVSALIGAGAFWLLAKTAGAFDIMMLILIANIFFAVTIAFLSKKRILSAVLAALFILVLFSASIDFEEITTGAVENSTENQTETAPPPASTTLASGFSGSFPDSALS